MANTANGEHPINGLMDVTLDKIKQMTDSNTIIGNPIHTADGTTILPVSKVSFGFASGGSDFVSAKAPKDLFGGGSGAALKVTPVGFLVINKGDVKLLEFTKKSDTTADRLVGMVPDLVDKVSALVSSAGKKDQTQA